MAALTTKLTVKKDSTTESVTSYSVQDEGTVQTATGGTFWQINNNGTTAYIGLWPTSVTSGGNPNHSMLKITKSGTQYWVEKTVNNNFTLTLAATTNQTITLKYTQPGASQVTKTSTSSAQNFTVKVGTTWTATIAGATGYNAGTLSPGSSGTVNANTTVSASAATVATRTITIKNSNVSPSIVISYTNSSGETASKTLNRGTSITSTTVSIKYNTSIKVFWGQNYSNDGEWETYSTAATLTIGSTAQGFVTLYSYDADPYLYNNGWGSNYATNNTYTSAKLTAATTFTFTYSSSGGGSMGEGSGGESNA